MNKIFFASLLFVWGCPAAQPTKDSAGGNGDTASDTGEQATAGVLVINEVLGRYGDKPSDPVVNEDGDPVDWLELYNAGDQTVNLSGWGLMDNSLAEPWILNVSVEVAPGEHVVVLADDQTDSTADFIHVAFKITSDGETITLYDPSGQKADQAVFPGQADTSEDGLSFARIPDGGEWSDTLVTPTPGASN